MLVKLFNPITNVLNTRCFAYCTDLIFDCFLFSVCIVNYDHRSFVRQVTGKEGLVNTVKAASFIKTTFIDCFIRNAIDGDIRLAVL